MDQFESLNHTKWDCKYHVVFIPKYRRRTLYGDLKRHLGPVFRQLAEQRESRVEEGHLMPDHVHMLLSIPPKYAVSQVVGYIKGKSAIHLARVRVLTKDRLENCGFCGEGVAIVVEVVVDPQRQIHHFHGLGDHLRAATEPRGKMTNVAVVLFDGDGQVFAGEELALRNEAVITLPIIGDERLAFDANFVEEMFACGVITATKNPGDGSPSNRVIGSPKPQFLSLFFTK